MCWIPRVSDAQLQTKQLQNQFHTDDQMYSLFNIEDAFWKILRTTGQTRPCKRRLVIRALKMREAKFEKISQHLGQGGGVD